MSYARPAVEDDFVNSFLGARIRALALDERMRERFISFAILEANADPQKFPPRLYHVMRGRTPSSYLALTIVKFFDERKYEEFHRLSEDFVEYITSDGNAEELKGLVASHPLALNVVQVRMTKPRFSYQNEEIQIRMRSPIIRLTQEELVEDQDCKLLNARLREFCMWVSEHKDIPHSFLLRSGKVVDIKYVPFWYRYSDETGFEGESEFHGGFEIQGIVQLLLFAEMGADSPDVCTGLDTFFYLSRIFDEGDFDFSDKKPSFAKFWPKIQACPSGVTEIFFSHIEVFPPLVRSPLESFYKKFASVHHEWIAKAKKDRVDIEESGEEYVPSASDALHYEEVREVFVKQLKPVLKACWRGFVPAALKVLELQRTRAREHFAKMEKYLK